MALEIFYTFDGKKLTPVSASYAEDQDALPRNVPLKAAISRPRSLPFDRLYRACIASICKSGGFDDGPDALHDVSKIECGWFKVIKLSTTGTYYKIPNSVAHDKMNASEFKTYFDQAIVFWKVEGLYSYISPDLRERLERGER